MVYSIIIIIIITLTMFFGVPVTTIETTIVNASMLVNHDWSQSVLLTPIQSLSGTLDTHANDLIQCQTRWA